MISHFHYQHGKELVLNIQRKKENSQMGGKKKDAEQPQVVRLACVKHGPGETSQPRSFFPSIKMLHREESGVTGNH